MGPNGRIRYARQVLLVCYHRICVDSDGSFMPHAVKCLRVCKSFRIELDDLKLPENVSEFFKSITYLEI